MPTTLRNGGLWIGGGLLFVVLATANAAGYRYGSSDQAFYIPAVARALDPALFPRDGALIDAQGRLILTDEILAFVVRSTGLPLDTLFFAAYVVSLAIIWAGLLLVGNRVYANPWLVAALAAAFTLRHRIPRTSANSFEPYFHPRMLAFGFGVLAVAALLRRRSWLMVLLVAASAAVHLTTALWFAVLLGVALLVVDAPARRLAAVAALAAAACAGWAIWGPLRPSLVVMDDVWLQAVASKDSLFPSQWPAWAWITNLAALPILWWAHRARVRCGEASPEDAGLAWGATALVALVLVTLPLVTAQVAIVVQFQISRVFWLVEFVALVYVLAALGRRARVAAALALLLLVGSAARGIYLMNVAYADRSLFAVHLPQSPWQEAMDWFSATGTDTHVLADPGHAWKYGTSVRVAAARDVFLEDTKDSAIAIYSRDVAARVVERTAAVGDFPELTPERALGLAVRYDLDYLVTESELPLPLAYRNRQFSIYRLSERGVARATAPRGAGE